VEELKVAEQLGPENGKLQTQIAKLYESLGKREDANAELAKARRLPERRYASLEDAIDAAESPTP
jgi:hypothetical protein